LLKQKNIKQTKFAEMMETGNTTVSNWINNVSYPDFRTLLRIKELLNVDLETLVYGDLESTIKLDNLRVMEKSKSFSGLEKEISFNEVGNSATSSAMELEFLKKTLVDKDREIDFLRKIIEKKM
jgi:transcriptional regulator with XRE-family HTH domain